MDRYEVYVRGCTICGTTLYDTASTRDYAEQLKSEAKSGMDKECDGKVVIIDTGKRERS